MGTEGFRNYYSYIMQMPIGTEDLPTPFALYTHQVQMVSEGYP